MIGATMLTGACARRAGTFGLSSPWFSKSSLAQTPENGDRSVRLNPHPSAIAKSGSGRIRKRYRICIGERSSSASHRPAANGRHLIKEGVDQGLPRYGVFVPKILTLLGEASTR